MAKKEEPIADSETGKIKVKAKANKEKQPDGNETKGNVTKVKTKMKKPAETIEETVTKVDLSKPVEETKVEETVEKIDESAVVEEVVESPTNQSAEETIEAPVIEEVTNEVVEEKVEDLQGQAEKAIIESQETGKPLPENIEKLVSFIEETGGDISDYVTLNRDYSELDNHTLLTEYYKSTKPHLSQEEIEFVMEDTFSYDEEVDEDREIKRKKLAMKEQVAQARQHLESVKSKYYEEIKGGSKLTDEQREAVDFFNRYNEQSDLNKQQVDIFKNKTNQVFDNNFKGFEYKVGDKKFRVNIKDADNVRETQSDINNFIKKFLNKDSAMEDAAGYHKGLFTAMNPDQIANHFYEQGKADALKDSIAKSKNVSMDPRQSHVDNVNTSGFKVRALNDDGPDFKFKIKNKNK